MRHEELVHAAELLSRIHGLPEREQKLLLRALTWYERGCQSKAEDQFVVWWISFDSLLGLLSKKDTSPNLIPEFLETYLRPASPDVFTKNQKTIEDLSSAQLTSFGGVERSKKLKDELQKRTSTPSSILIKATLCIYEVRNNLFHAGVSSNLLQVSASLLADIIRETIRTYTTLNH